MYPHTITIRENLVRASPTFGGSLFTSTRPPAAQTLRPSRIYHFHDLSPLSIENRHAKTLDSPLTHDPAKLQPLLVAEPATLQGQAQYLAWLNNILQTVPLPPPSRTRMTMRWRGCRIRWWNARILKGVVCAITPSFGLAQPGFKLLGYASQG